MGTRERMGVHGIGTEILGTWALLAGWPLDGHCRWLLGVAGRQTVAHAGPISSLVMAMCRLLAGCQSRGPTSPGRGGLSPRGSSGLPAWLLRPPGSAGAGATASLGSSTQLGRQGRWHAFLAWLGNKSKLNTYPSSSQPGSRGPGAARSAPGRRKLWRLPQPSGPCICCTSCNSGST